MIKGLLSGGKYVEVNGTCYDKDTKDEVIRHLEYTRKNRQRIRVFYGDAITGRDWLEEHNTMGFVGRSTGVRKSPLLIHSDRSLGGGIILTKNIVKMTVNKRVVYQHPKYHLPELIVIDDPSEFSVDELDYAARVQTEDDVIAYFDNPVKASKFVAFLKGERNTK